MATTRFFDFTRTDKTLSFHITGLDTSIVNALRRTILTDIGVACIRFIPDKPEANDDVTFIKNTTNLHNEFIGHRLTMVPLCFSREELRNFQPQNYKFVIDELNDTETPKPVRTEHIKIYDQKGNLYPKEFHEKIFRKNPITGSTILLTKLMPTFHLHLEARASIGTAREWAGWSPVSLSVYEFVVDEEAATKEEEAFIAKKKEEGATNLEALRADFHNLNRFRHYKKDKSGEPSEFKFSLETECGLTCDDLVDMAFEVISNGLEKIYNGTYDITSKDNKVILVNNINHTLGHIIMWHLYTNCTDKITYQGYNMPHPLENCCEFKIITKSPEPIEDLFKQEVEKLKRYIDSVRNEWQKV